MPGNYFNLSRDTPTVNPTPQDQEDPLYRNELRRLLTVPGAFSGTPGFQFSVDAATQAAERAMSARGLGNSGNLLAEIVRQASGLASQDYGNQVDRLGRLSGQEDQYRLGRESNANIRRGQDVTSHGQDLDFGLGTYRATNDYNLGRETNANGAQRDAWNYDLGRERNSIDSAANRNRYDLDWYNADTARGTARSTDYWRGRPPPRY